MKASVKYYTRNETRKDGLAPLFASIYAGGRRTRTAALLYCERAKFDVPRQIFKPSCRVLQGSAPIPVAEANLKLLQAAVAVARLASERRDAPAEAELLEVLGEAFRTGNRRKSATLRELIADMVDEYRKAGKAVNMYETIAAGLRTYEEYVGKAQTCENFEPARFLDFLANASQIEENTGVFARTGRRKPRNATKGGLKACDAFLRVIAAWCVKRGRTSLNFMAGTEAPGAAEREPICLVTAELDRLQATELEGKLAEVRDLFLLQCSLGCRQSDLRRITGAHASAGVFEYIPAKTRGQSHRVVSVPLNRRAAAILRENPGIVEVARTIPLTEYNRLIKAAAKAAGLDRPVCTYVRDKEETLPLWRLLSSHAARRTFISTLLNAGVQERVIKDMDGHSADSKAFRRYYTIERSTKEAAVKALE